MWKKNKEENRPRFSQISPKAVHIEKTFLIGSNETPTSLLIFSVSEASAWEIEEGKTVVSLWL